MFMKKNIKNLPNSIPIFPLDGALLLPGGILPLNIFEPRYIALVDSVIGDHRLVGMIQPLSNNELNNKNLYPVGCAGRITSLTETEDNRYLIELTGLLRFKISKEQKSINGFRLIAPDWEGYKLDLMPPNESSIDRTELFDEIKKYFSRNKIDANMSDISSASLHQLVSTFSQICSFQPNEKQALLEAVSLEDRVKIMTSLLKMDGVANLGGTSLIN